jgi:hypothetical protein
MPIGNKFKKSCGFRFSWRHVRSGLSSAAIPTAFKRCSGRDIVNAMTEKVILGHGIHNEIALIELADLKPQ